MISFDLSFDYRCPFAKNIHLHVLDALRAGAAFDVTFVPWTLSQGHRPEGAPDVWDDPAQDSHLLALAAGVSVRDQQPDRFLDAHEALFRARHERALRLASPDQVAGVLAEVGVDVDAVAADVASRRPHQVIAESHRVFDRYEAFGVPTFVLGHDAVFVRYMDPPTGDAAESERIISSILTLMSAEPRLNEFKHTQLPS